MSKECDWCGKIYRESQCDPYCSRRCQKAGRIDECGEDRELTIGEEFGKGFKQIKQGVADEVSKYVWLAVIIGIVVLFMKCCG